MLFDTFLNFEINYVKEKKRKKIRKGHNYQ